MSWLEIPPESPFQVGTLPYGIFSAPPGPPRVGAAIGGHVLDLAAVADDLRTPHVELFDQPGLNRLMAQGPRVWRDIRSRITSWLTEPAQRSLVAPHLVHGSRVRMHLPIEVGDFADFYASEQHAANIGRILRPGAEPLRPNWKHLPVGYHGRAGTVVVSGTPVQRPRGQRAAADFGATRCLDFEAEIGFVVGVPSRPGHPVGVDEFAQHVFGLCLVNDWSARDIQAWECVPLGPFAAKSFATSVSPWVVPLEALEQARVDPPPRDPPPLPYLDDSGHRWGLDLTLEVRLNEQLIARPPFATMYWTAPQLLSQLTAGGAALRTGDLFASGTVSGPRPHQYGSLIELTWNGERPLSLADGSRRAFLADGDEVLISATAPGPVGFGEVRGRICAAAPVRLVEP